MTNSVNPAATLPGAANGERNMLDCINDLHMIATELGFISIAIASNAQLEHMEGQDTTYNSGLCWAIERLSKAIHTVSGDVHALFKQGRNQSQATASAAGEVSHG